MYTHVHTLRTPDIDAYTHNRCIYVRIIIMPNSTIRINIKINRERFILKTYKQVRLGRLFITIEIIFRFKITYL